MVSKNIHHSTIAEISTLIAQRELSPVDLIKSHLERIRELEPELNSFVTILENESLLEAQKAESEIISEGSRGSLHGIPVGLKDLYYTKGVRTTIGSNIMSDFTPNKDATVTKKLRKAGAIIIGKLQMHEFAWGTTSENPHYGPAHNPWDTKHITGGSSGGSGSAVSSGQCMGALGSDTGGSVRIPSALCGIVGLKPTFGLVSKNGVFPLSWSMDTVGTMTRTVKDAALMLNVIAGFDQADPSSVRQKTENYCSTLDNEIGGLKIGILKNEMFKRVDSDISSCFSQAVHTLENLGTSIEEISIPIMDHSFSIAQTILGAEAAEIHTENLRENSELIDPEVRAKLQIGALTSATEYIKAQRARRLFNQQTRTAMKALDVLITPTVAIGAPKIGENTINIAGKQESRTELLGRLTRPFNLCGYPSVSIPCGFTTKGMPVGLQIVGKPFQESTVLRTAYAYEQSTTWHNIKPKI